MEPFTYDEKKGIFWITPWMKKYPSLTAGVTSRHLPGAEEEGNLAFHVTENAAGVVKNRTALARLVDFPLSSMTCALQPHGRQVARVDEKTRGAGATSYLSSIEKADGLLTSLSETLLTLFFADCVPLFFFDPGRMVIGIAHAGWRGTVRNIGQEMVEKMEKNYGTRRGEIWAAIGPSIGPCCYQVDEPVMEGVREVLPEEWEEVSIPEGKGFFRLDLRKMNQILFEKEGIRRENIEVTHICTSCRTDLLFSHRKEKGKTGRMAAFIGLKEGRA
ncbi:peptidoglycan editing factor PgeF [Thermicanus aegyptius]|uniref:peptidoglycan editing factor PgeF n=1 Tax=Thermicanus aegyptius TaxID=94009 RepID=UPI00040D1125|nr:peptidoglycan editing factor PgeF [Thermicanus aegyptius]